MDLAARQGLVVRVCVQSGQFVHSAAASCPGGGFTGQAWRQRWGQCVRGAVQGRALRLGARDFVPCAGQRTRSRAPREHIVRGRIDFLLTRPREAGGAAERRGFAGGPVHSEKLARSRSVCQRDPVTEGAPSGAHQQPMLTGQPRVRRSIAQAPLSMPLYTGRTEQVRPCSVHACASALSAHAVGVYVAFMSAGLVQLTAHRHPCIRVPPLASPMQCARHGAACSPSAQAFC